MARLSDVGIECIPDSFNAQEGVILELVNPSRHQLHEAKSHLRTREHHCYSQRQECSARAKLRDATLEMHSNVRPTTDLMTPLKRTEHPEPARRRQRTLVSHDRQRERVGNKVAGTPGTSSFVTPKDTR